MIHGKIPLEVVGHDPITIPIEHYLFDACLSHIGLAGINFRHDLIEGLVFTLTELPTTQYASSVSGNIKRQDWVAFNTVSVVFMGNIKTRCARQIPLSLLAIPNGWHVFWPCLFRSLENGLICIE